MKKLITLTLALTFLALATQDVAAQTVLEWDWTGGAGNWSWTDGGNWDLVAGSGAPQSYPYKANTGDSNEPQNIVNIDADATAGTIEGIPSVSGWDTFQGIINLNSGKMGLIANLYTGGVNQHTATPVGFNVGDGVGAAGSAILDLANSRWTPCRHPVTDNAYVIQVESDGLLTSAVNGKIQGGNMDQRKAFFYIRGGTFSIYHLALDEFDVDAGTDLDQFHLTGGVWEIELFTKHAGDTLYLGGGTIKSRTGGAITVNAANDPDRMKLTGIDSLGNAQDTTFDTSNGDITWQNILSGTGGLVATGGGTFTLSAANTYTGNTTIDGATLDITGSLYNNGGTPVAATFAVLNSTLTDYDFGTPLGDLQTGAAGMFLDNTTLRSTASDTLNRSFSVGANGATLESVTAGETWTIASSEAINVLGNSFIFTGAGDIVVAAGITGAASVTKDGAGTCTLAAASSYLGDTLVNAGTLNINSSVYSQAFGGTFVVQNGATLNFLPGTSVNFRETPSATKLTFDLAATATVSGATNLGFTNVGNIELLGDFTFDQQFTFNQQNLLLGSSTRNTTMRLDGSVAGGTLNSLVVATGSSLILEVHEANATGNNNAVLDVAGAITVRPQDLTITIDNVALQAGREFDVFTGNWTNADAEALSTEYNGFGVLYSYEGNLLRGQLRELNNQLPTADDYRYVTNPEAINALLDPTTLAPAGTPMGDFQRHLKEKWRIGTNIERIDQYVQQFTPSMAAAAFSQSVNVNQQILQQVASQLVVPWQSDRFGRFATVRGQNATMVMPETSILGHRALNNAWFQTFAYGATQGEKDGFAPYNSNGWGFATGGDRKLASNLLLGAAYAYTSNELSSQAWNTGDPSPNRNLLQTHTLLTYGLTRLGQKGFASVKLGCTWTLGDGDAYLPLLNEQATYKTDAATFLFQGAAGYRWFETKRLTLSPKVRAGYFHYWQNGYDVETTSGALAMRNGRFESGYWACDLLLDWSLRASGAITFTGTMGFRSVLNADNVSWTTGTNDLQFQVNGVAPSSDLFVLDAGADLWLTPNMSLILEYNLRAGDNDYLLSGGTCTFVSKF